MRAMRRLACLVAVVVLLVSAVAAGAQTTSPDPSDLTATTATCSVELSWNAPTSQLSTVTGYRLQRSKGTEPFVTLIADTESTDTTYSDSIAERGETYSYRVLALRDSTVGAASNIASVDVPSVPTATPVIIDAVPIEVTSTAADYFVLYAKHTVDGTEVDTPIAVVRGNTGTTALTENVSALPLAQYRVDKHQIDDPADVDGDCVDDITELDNPASMNPVNPAVGVDIAHAAVAIPDHATFEQLAFVDSDRNSYVKFSVFGHDTNRPSYYFINTAEHLTHAGLLETNVFEYEEGRLGRELPVYGQNAIKGQIIYDSNLQAPDGSSGVYWYILDDDQQYPFDRMARHYTLLAAQMPAVDNNLAVFVPNSLLPTLRSELEAYRESRVNVVFADDTQTDVDFVAANTGVGFGVLRSIDGDERPNPRDIVIYKALPNELPRVAGIVSTVPQTPLSHVNLRAAQDGIPNAFVRNALNDPSVQSLLDKHIRYEVTQSGWEIRAATLAEVNAYYVSSRPTARQTPKRDLSTKGIAALGNIGFDDWDSFGVKAANLAVLRTLGLPAGTVPNGFAIPFYFYDEFMKHNELYEYIDTMLANAEFQTDFDAQGG